MSYLVDDCILAGHALIACPAADCGSGATSCRGGGAGDVCEADLGADALEVAGAIAFADPGDGWSPGSERSAGAPGSGAAHALA